MAKIPLVVNTFVDASGAPIANGYLIVRLNVDGSVNDTQLGSAFAKLLLNSSGQIVTGPIFWPNASIAPPGTYYIQSVYTAAGQLVSGPNKITV
jgi:hypothetical protein